MALAVFFAMTGFLCGLGAGEGNSLPPI